MAKLESLVVDLKLNSGDLRKGIDAANAKIESLGAKVSKLSGQMNLSAVVSMTKQATSALITFVKHGADTADATGKMAAAAGVSVEAFSRLQYAAQLGGVGAEEFSSAMAKLNKNISEAATGNKEQVAIFNALGVSVKDAGGKVKSADVVFSELAEAFDKLAPGASKAKLEMDLLGKTGAKFENVFAGGAKGLKELGEEADRLGITISGKTAKSAQEFNDNVERLELAMERVGVRVAGEVSPAFAKLTKFLLDTKEGADLLKGVVTVLANVMKVLATIAILVGEAFNIVGTLIGSTIATVVEVISGNLRGASEAQAQADEDLKKSLATTGKLISSVWTDAGDSADDGAKKVVRSSDAVAQSAADTKKALSAQEQAIKELTKTAVDFESKVAAFGKGPLAELETSLDSGHLSEQLALAGSKADGLRERILAAAEALHQLDAGKLSGELDFDLATKKRATGRSVDAQRKEFASASTGGLTERQGAVQKTQGFDSFDSALSEMAQQTDRQNRMIATARQQEFEGDVEGARWATLQAEESEIAASKAQEAAAGWKDLAEIDFNEHKRKLEAVLSGFAAIGQQFLGKLGDLGEVVNAGIQGFEAGGVWGAIIAVIIDLISRFEGFGAIMDIAQGLVNGAIADLAGGFKSVIEALRPLLGAFGMIFKSVHGVLMPILELIGSVLEGLAPIFAILGLVLKPLGGLFKSIGTVIQMVLVPVMEVLAYVFIGIGLVMSGLQIATAAVWLALVTAGDEILKAFGNKSLSNARDEANQALVNSIKDAEDLAKTDPKKLMEMANASADAAEELGKTKEEVKDLGDKSKKTGDALDRLSAQFTNVPDGFRLAYRRFQSSDTEPGAGAGGVGNNMTIVVQGSLVSEREVTAYMNQSQAKVNWQRLGWSTP